MIPLLQAALVASATSASTSLLIVASQQWHGRHTFDHDLDGVQKFHTTAVPRIGGVAIVVAICAVLVLGGWFGLPLVPLEHLKYAALLLVAGLPVFAAGITEDITKHVSVKVRLVASITSALLASWLLGTIIDELDIWGVDALLTWTPFAIVVTAITVSGGVNAINIIDGFNGLASSAVIIMLAALSAVSVLVGDTLVTGLAMIGLGAVAGFFVINFPNGKLFLGDGGAYFLGFWVAEVILLLLIRNSSVSAWQLLSICAYPVIEVLFSIYRRRILRQSNPGQPDGLHLHTLVYRRLVLRRCRHDTRRPWKRNATVACVIVPWIALASLLSILVGASKVASGVLVLVQAVAYLAVYSRLVRGRWTARPVSPRAAAPIEPSPWSEQAYAQRAIKVALERDYCVMQSEEQTELS